MNHQFENHFYRIPHDLSGQTALVISEELSNMPVHRMGTMILSLENVKSIDATGLAILVRLYSHMSSLGKKMFLTDVPQSIKKSMTQLGLDRVLSYLEIPVARNSYSGVHKIATCSSYLDAIGFWFDLTVGSPFFCANTPHKETLGLIPSLLSCESRSSFWSSMNDEPVSVSRSVT